MKKREYIHKDNFWVDIQLNTPIPIAMERNTITEQEIVKPYLDRIKAEIETLNPVDYVSMSSYEGHKGASDMKDDVLQIIDKHMEEV